MIHNNTLEGLRLCQNPLFLIPISVKPDGVDLQTFRPVDLFQTQIILSNRIYNLKYLWSPPLSCKDIGIKQIRVCGKDSNPLYLSEDKESKKSYKSLRMTFKGSVREK